MAIEDRFAGYTPSSAGPYTRAAAVSPDDDADLSFRPLALVAAVAGVVNVHMQGSTTPVAVGIAAGIPLPIRVDRVLAASTTATGIVALD